MNERIRLLAEQAGLKIPVDAEYNGHIYRHALEKFAKLIVGECLEQIDKIRDGCEADNEDQQALGADWAGLAVARHFGVKE
jgi:hypothetical protein